MSEKLPLVSVVMATYNRAAMLPRAIESVLNQTMADLEFIIVDDGSTDGSHGIVEEYSDKGGRIVFIKQANSGLARARNHAIQRARGRYVAMMDDDDYCHPDRIKEQVAFLRAHKELQACSCLWVYEDKTTGYSRRQNYSDYISLFRPKDVPEEVPIPPIVLNTTTMIKRSALVALKGYRPFFPCGIDYDLTLRFQERFQGGLLQRYLYYRDGGENYNRITKDDFVKIMHMHIIGHISAWYRRNKGSDPVEENRSSEEILAMLSVMPPSSRRHILIYVKRCIDRVLNLSPGQKTSKNLMAVKTTFAYVKPGLIFTYALPGLIRRRNSYIVAILRIKRKLVLWQWDCILRRFN